MNSGRPSNTGSAQATAEKKAVKLTPWWQDCVIPGGSPTSPILAGSRALGSELSKLQARLVAYKTVHSNSWLGFKLTFPLPEAQAASEKAGFGVVYNRKLIDPRRGCDSLSAASPFRVHVAGGPLSKIFPFSFFFFFFFSFFFFSFFFLLTGISS